MEPAPVAPAAETDAAAPEVSEQPTMMLSASELLRLVRIARQLEAAAAAPADDPPDRAKA